MPPFLRLSDRVAARLRGMPWAFLLPFAPVAIGARVVAGSELRAIARAEADVVPVSGVVLASRVETLPCYGTCKGGPQYRPAVAVTYERAGQAETTYTVTARGAAGSSAWAASAVGRYPVGGATTVQVPRDRARRAFLESEPRGGLYALLLIPLLCWAGGTVALWLHARRTDAA